MLAIHKTATIRAKPKKRFADRFTFLANQSNKIKVRPTNSIAKNATSYKLIWNVYGFKQSNSQSLFQIYKTLIYNELVDIANMHYAITEQLAFGYKGAMI